jgi:pyridoxal phosphate enzyme (YggS family)
VTDVRRAELEGNLRSVRRRIADACIAAGRAPDEVTLVAVTKFFPASDAAALYRLGVHDLGESRDQEAATKVADVARLLGEVGQPRWHFVGRLQTNKARSVARYADLVHSVDRPDLVTALADGARRTGRQLPVLVQVSLDEDAARGGAGRSVALGLADRVVGTGTLHLRGVMAIAPLRSDPNRAFALLADVAERVRAAHTGADVISAGMSDDLEPAIRHGATHVRIGTALLGRRKAHLG